jgi:hypothetical protein
MKTRFRFGLPRQMAGLLLILCYLAVSHGRAAGAVALPPEGLAPEAILSEARLSLAEARKTQSDPRTAVGHYGSAHCLCSQSQGIWAIVLAHQAGLSIRKIAGATGLSSSRIHQLAAVETPLLDRNAR